MTINYLKRAGKPDLAYCHQPAADDGAALPLVMFCPGFRSDMDGTKALFLQERCAARGQACLRFDYSGHGLSGGDFADGTIGMWAEDAQAVLDQAAPARAVIVGSSMGGWIALLLARARPAMAAGVVGLAAAPDFTEDIYQNRMNDEQRARLETQGYIDVPNDYSDEPYRISRILIEDGRDHCLLGGFDLPCPLRLMQGMQDTDVTWQTAYRIKNALGDPAQAVVTLIESGDHRLSRPEDLEMLDREVRIVSGLEREAAQAQAL